MSEITKDVAAVSTLPVVLKRPAPCPDPRSAPCLAPDPSSDVSLSSSVSPSKSVASAQPAKKAKRAKKTQSKQDDRLYCPSFECKKWRGTQEELIQHLASDHECDAIEWSENGDGLVFRGWENPTIFLVNVLRMQDEKEKEAVESSSSSSSSSSLPSPSSSSSQVVDSRDADNSKDAGNSERVTDSNTIEKKEVQKQYVLTSKPFGAKNKYLELCIYRVHPLEKSSSNDAVSSIAQNRIIELYMGDWDQRQFSLARCADAEIGLDKNPHNASMALCNNRIVIQSKQAVEMCKSCRAARPDWDDKLLDEAPKIVNGKPLVTFDEPTDPISISLAICNLEV